MDEIEIVRVLAKAVLLIQEIMLRNVVMLSFAAWYVQRRRAMDTDSSDSSEQSETMTNESDDDSETSTSSVCQPRIRAPNNETEGRKRKRESSDGVDRVYERLTSFFRSSDARMDEISKRFDEISKVIGFENDNSNAREKVFGEVDKIAGLTLEDKVSVCRLLGNDDGDLELFFSLPDDARVEFVKIILAGRSL